MPTIELADDRIKSVTAITAGVDVPENVTHIRYSTMGYESGKARWFERDPQEKTEPQFRNPYLWRRCDDQDEEVVTWVDGKDLIAKTRHVLPTGQTVTSDRTPPAVHGVAAAVEESQQQVAAATE